MKKRYFISSILLFFVLAGSAFSQVDFGFTLGTEYGFGLIARAGTRSVMLEAGGGIAPTFILWNINFGDTYFKLYFPFTAGAKLCFGLGGFSKNDIAYIKIGGSYNTIMKMGFGGGADYTFGEKTKYVISAGAYFFPKSYDELLTRLNDEEGTHYAKDDTSSFLVQFQPFIAFSILF
ncbi:MAG: hypothetical protein JXB26_08615 [Candidatus Aminicenantes bacterium]|nr:hypothetical protein [Candidatus Aminicenantes bacterium]